MTSDIHVHGPEGNVETRQRGGFMSERSARYADMAKSVAPPRPDPVPEDQPEAPAPWEGLDDGWSAAEAAYEIMYTLRYETLTDTQRLILTYGLMLTDLVFQKNLRYGNSALEPIAVFAKDISPEQRMAVRMDDKVNRIVHGQGTFANDGENPLVDLAGYILLRLVGDERSRAAKG